MTKIYSVTLFFLFPILLPSLVFAYTSPGKPMGFVNDFAKVLSAQEIQTIDSQLQSLQNSTGVQIAVVTLSSLGDETIETFAVKLFQEWGIGEKGKDNGLLILVAPSDRQVKIEVGYGLEGTVTDLQSGNIIRNVMTPAFKDGKYDEGIAGAVDALTAIITNSPEAAQYSIQSSSNDSSSGLNENFAGLFFLGIIILNFLARILGKTKSWWLGGVVGAVVGAIIGLIWGFVFLGIGSIVVLTILGLVFDFIVSKRPPGSSGGHGGIWPIFFGGGRGGSSGFGGGGFGGFGGGMSGGGGASGRW